jgi:hypothetical protein
MNWLNRKVDKALGISVLLVIAGVLLALCAFGQAVLQLVS